MAVLQLACTFLKHFIELNNTSAKYDDFLVPKWKQVDDIDNISSTKNSVLLNWIYKINTENFINVHLSPYKI